MSSLEASKYLGGDMEHTHLVKGLDFALLNKVRDDLKKQRVEDEKQQDEAQQEEDETVANPVGRSRMAKGVLLALSTKSEAAAGRGEKAKDIFRTGRTLFRFEHVDGHGQESTALPSRIMRSLHDCPKLQSRRTADIDPELLGEIHLWNFSGSVRGG